MDLLGKEHCTASSRQSSTGASLTRKRLSSVPSDLPSILFSTVFDIPEDAADNRCLCRKPMTSACYRWQCSLRMLSGCKTLFLSQDRHTHYLFVQRAELQPSAHSHVPFLLIFPEHRAEHQISQIEQPEARINQRARSVSLHGAPASVGVDVEVIQQ